ncbi:MAG: YncE family protein, partial [Flavobacteriales bacterium]
MKRSAALLLLLFAMDAHAQLGRKIYAGMGYTSNIVVYDAATLDSLDFIAGAGGYRMAYCAPLNKVYSTDGGSQITVVDAVSNAIIDQFQPVFAGTFTSELEAITISPDGATVYAADESSGSIFAISTANDSVVNGAPLPVDEPENLCISPDGAYLYMADNSEVHKIDAATLAIVASAFV